MNGAWTTVICLSLFVAAAWGQETPDEEAELARGLELLFGDNSGLWPYDEVCDDNRFMGDRLYYYHWPSGENNGKDAADCRALFIAGNIKWRGKKHEVQEVDALLDVARGNPSIVNAALEEAGATDEDQEEGHPE